MISYSFLIEIDFLIGRLNNVDKANIIKKEMKVSNIPRKNVLKQHERKILFTPPYIN